MKKKNSALQGVERNSVTKKKWCEKMTIIGCWYLKEKDRIVDGIGEEISEIKIFALSFLLSTWRE